MQLRQHPLLTHRGNPSWPPVWHQQRTLGSQMLQGEIGVLKNVYYSEQAEARICYLVIEHESKVFIGTLQFDDPHICTEVCRVLHEQIGHTIREIGDLDISGSASL